MKHFVSIGLLLAFAPTVMPQKAPHTMLAVIAHADDEAFIGLLLSRFLSVTSVSPSVRVGN